MTHTANPLHTIYYRAKARFEADGSRLSHRPGTNRCLYRGPNGAKCLIGHVIDDEHLDPAYNGWGASSPQIMNAVIRSNPDLNLDLSLPAVQLGEFLCRVQQLHDLAVDEDRSINFAAFEATL